MFDSIISVTMTLSQFVLCILFAIVLGVLNALVFSFRSSSSSNWCSTLAILPPVVTLVIMMVNGNIGAGLAVAGTFSLIRFRSAQGNAREIAGIFTSTAIGLACGMGFVGIAALFFLMMAVFVLVLTLTRFGEAKGSYRRLKINIPENLDYDGLFDDLFAKYTTGHELVRVKTANMGTLFELSYDIYLKDKEITKEFIDAIRCRNGNLNVSCTRSNTNDSI